MGFIFKRATHGIRCSSADGYQTALNYRERPFWIGGELLVFVVRPHTPNRDASTVPPLIYIQCFAFVLRDEVDELDNRHSVFWHSLVQWLRVVKTPFKMLAKDAKNAKKSNPNNQLFFDGQKFQSVSV